MRKQLRLSGSGGQGVITAAIILAEAAVMEGKDAVQSQSYGPEARGGASKSADKYFADLHEDGILVLDSDLVPDVPDAKNIVQIPITRLAVEELGKALFANIVALGALVRLTGIVDFETIKTAVAHRVPPHTVDQNMQALQIGYDAADAAQASYNQVA